MRGAAKLICASFLHMHNEQAFVTKTRNPGRRTGGSRGNKRRFSFCIFTAIRGNILLVYVTYKAVPAMWGFLQDFAGWIIFPGAWGRGYKCLVHKKSINKN